MTTKFKASDYSNLAKEYDLRKGVLDLLTLMRIPRAKTDASRVWGRDGKTRETKVDEGWPDISACVAGRFWAIEAKTRKGRLLDSQKITLLQLESERAVISIPRALIDVARDYLTRFRDDPRYRERAQIIARVDWNREEWAIIEKLTKGVL